MEKIRAYIETNPVKAALAADPRDSNYGTERHPKQARKCTHFACIYVCILLTLVCDVVSKPGLLKLSRKHPETLRTLALWYKIVKRAQWRSLNEVRKDYPSADQVGNVLIFNVPGGNYRLIVRVTYTGQRIYVKALMTHGEYDRKEWMKWA